MTNTSVTPTVEWTEQDFEVALLLFVLLPLVSAAILW